jgi:hypothetical protein
LRAILQRCDVAYLVRPTFILCIMNGNHISEINKNFIT